MRLFSALRQRKWPRPKRFDRNLVVIGAGAGGLVSAYLAATAQARVTLVESHRMGGDCLNTGCVPSKTLIRSARLLREWREAGRLGLSGPGAQADFADVMARVRSVIGQVAPHDSAERYSGLGVEVVQGHARITSPWTVEIDSAGGCRTLSTRAIVIATGAEPVIPDIPGIDSVRHVTSDTVWSMPHRPGRLVVLGAGPIGCELAQAFAVLGSEVVLVTRSGILGKEDPEAVALVEAGMLADGVTLLKGAQPLRCETDGGRQRLIVSHQGDERALPFDALLCATGRKPRVNGLGLEALGIALAPGGGIAVNGYLQTSHPNIYACGDVVGPDQFTHAAAHQAGYAVVNALLGGAWRFRVDARVLPRVTFTAPEVARVGLSEAEAKARGIPHEVTRYGLEDFDRALMEGAVQGFIKVLTPPGRDRLLGVTIVGAQAGEQLAEFTLAMQHGIGLNGILATIHPYPTWSEAGKHVAGAWKRAHAPRWALGWLARLHAWRRG